MVLESTWPTRSAIAPPAGRERALMREGAMQVDGLQAAAAKRSWDVMSVARMACCLWARQQVAGFVVVSRGCPVEAAWAR